MIRAAVVCHACAETLLMSGDVRNYSSSSWLNGVVVDDGQYYRVVLFQMRTICLVWTRKQTVDFPSKTPATNKLASSEFFWTFDGSWRGFKVGVHVIDGVCKLL